MESRRPQRPTSTYDSPSCSPQSSSWSASAAASPCEPPDMASSVLPLHSSSSLWSSFSACPDRRRRFPSRPGDSVSSRSWGAEACFRLTWLTGAWSSVDLEELRESLKQFQVPPQDGDHVLLHGLGW